MRRLMAAGAVTLVVVAGCGGSGHKQARPPTSTTSQGGGGVVRAEPTKGLLGPAINIQNGRVVIRAKGGGAISPKEDRPTDAQEHAVGGSGACANTAANPSRRNLRRMSAAILCLLNAERRSKGMPALHRNRKLRKAARGWANRLVAARFFAHESGHSTVETRIKKTGYIRGNWVIGENLAWGSGALATPRAIVNGWMNSPPHRANILYSRFRDIGIGIRLGAPGANLSGGATYVTDFGRHS